MSRGFAIPTNASDRWFRTGDVKNLLAAFDDADQADSGRREDLTNFARIYANRNLVGLSPSTYSRILSGERVNVNVCKAAVDVAVARLARHRIRPRFLTSAGNASLRRKARLMERWSDATFYTSGAFEAMAGAIQHAAVFGTGVLHAYADGTRIRVERVFPGNVLVDAADASEGAPTILYRRMDVARDVAAARWPKFAEKIERLASNSWRHAGDGRMIEVVEAWKLAGAEKGRHILAVRGVEEAIIDEEYDCGEFPFVFVRWTPPVRGFWGVGLVEELLGINIEINRLLQRIQKAFHLFAVPQVWVEAGSRVKKTQLTNEIGAVYQYSGTPPQFFTPSAMTPEVFRHVDWLYARAFEIAGVGRSAGPPPAGLTSGAAIREWSGAADDRFATLLAAVEAGYCALARRFVELGKKIAEENPRWKVVASRDRNTVAEVPWKEIDLDRDAYVLRVYPASSLPLDPAGRLSSVVEMYNAGLISPQTAQRLLDYPDLEEELSLERASSDAISAVIEKILDDGEVVMPEPFVDLQLALKKAQAAYNRAKADGGVPEDRLEALRRFMAGVESMLRRAAQAAAAEQAALAPAPMSRNGLGQDPMAVAGADRRISS